MQLVTFMPPDGQPRAGVLLDSAVIDLAHAAPLALEEAAGLRWDMLSILQGDQEGCSLDTAAEIVAAVIAAAGSDIDSSNSNGLEGNGSQNSGMAGTLSIGGIEMLLPLAQVRLLAPLPRPASLRLFDAFGGASERPPVTYRLPAFAFGNHGAIYGPEETVPMPSSDTLGCTLEVACIIGHSGHDIDPDEAQDYIAGYTIASNWIAYDDTASTGPPGPGTAGARIIATSLGPAIVTPDELELYDEGEGRFLLSMQARVNGIARQRSTFSAIVHTFPVMIAYASRDVLLYPGDVLCSGAAAASIDYLEHGDMVEHDITALGVLRNQIV